MSWYYMAVAVQHQILGPGSPGSPGSGARQVDIRGSSDKAFLQDLEALIDQRIEEPGR